MSVISVMKRMFMSCLLMVVLIPVMALASAAETYLTNWEVLGAFANTTVTSHWRSQFEINYLASAGGETSTRLYSQSAVDYKDNYYQWLPLYADESGKVAINQAYVIETGLSVFYAYADFNCPKSGKALLKLSSNGAVRGWLNGKLIADHLENGSSIEEDYVQIPVKLKEGSNLLLLKINQVPGTPAEFKASLKAPYSLIDHLASWLPFILIIAVWALIGITLQKSRQDKPDGYPEGRLVSLDALRGFDMFWITGGGTVIVLLAKACGNYNLLTQLDHKTWNGLTCWDLIFPTFLFIVGTAIPFAFAKRLQQGTPKGKLYGHILKRTLALFIVGLILAGGLNKMPLSELRIAGVLQRIAICYFFASVLYLNLDWKKLAGVSAVILVGYWLIMTLVPVPGIGKPVLVPDQNLANWIDLHYLPGSLYQGTWDNEGILSTLPAIVTALMGVLAGIWLQSKNEGPKKAQYIFYAGVISVIAGWLWGFLFPINKLLWTSTYVLAAGGWSLILLSVFYWVMDVKKWRRWAFPFVVIGANAIGAYAIRPFIKFGDIAARIAGGSLAKLFGTYAELWMALIAYLLLWSSLYWLYKKRIFIKL
jgi:predicted acyltransferase